MIATRLLSLVLAASAAIEARADWINLCPAADPAVLKPDYLSHTVRDDRQVERFGLSEEADLGDRCLKREVPFKRGDVIWARTLANDQQTYKATHIALQGKVKGESFHVTELILPEVEAPKGPVVRSVAVPGTNLLPTLMDSTFGREERARVVRQAGRLRLDCDPGTSAAGMVLNSPSALPRHALLQFGFKAEGQGRFGVGYSDRKRADAGDPIDLGSISLGKSEDGWYPVPTPREKTMLADWHSLTVNCPAQAAHLVLDELRLNSSELPTRKLSRASWFWSADAWRSRPELIFARQREWRLNRAYIGVESSQGAVKDAGLLQSFVSQAHKQGLEIWVVFGEPQAIYPEGRLLYQSYVRSVSDYNRQSPADARINGIQLDIEPYLDAGFSGGVETWKRPYEKAILEISAVSELPVELVMPFWLHDDAGFLDRLAPAISGVVVMDYRTDPASIAERALPFLEWGSARHKPVTVALETLAFPAESRRYFGRAEAGELLAVRLGNHTLLILLGKPVTLEDATTFLWRSTREASAGQVSFAGHEDDLMALLPTLERELNAWDSFAGLAVHGLDRSGPPLVLPH